MDQFRRISTSKNPQGVGAVFTLPPYKGLSLPSVVGSKILFLDDVQDPGNVGTLIRSASAFNFDGVLLSDGCADPFAPKTLQSTAGGIGALWVRKSSTVLQFLKELKEQEFIVASADIRGSTDFSVLENDKIVVVLGNEGTGISEAVLNLSDHLYKIPYNNEAVESLNVGVAGALCMFHIQQNAL